MVDYYNLFIFLNNSRIECFKLPLGLYSDIECLIRKFWWDQRRDCSKIHLVKWETKGAMGLKDLNLFNDTLLANQVWHLLHNKQTMCYIVFVSIRYYLLFYPKTFFFLGI